MSWLFEGSPTVYLILGVAALILLGLGLRTRQRKYALGLGVVAVLAGLVWLADFLVVTDREQIVNKIKAMTDSVARKDVEGIFQHMTRDFHFRSMDRNKFRAYVEGAIRSGGVDEVAVWDFEPGEVSREKRTGTVTFKAKPVGRWAMGTEFSLVRAEFVLESDGQWRMRSFELFNPFIDTTQPWQFPLP
jgi:hypothetical protein